MLAPGVLDRLDGRLGERLREVDALDLGAAGLRQRCDLDVDDVLHGPSSQRRFGCDDPTVKPRTATPPAVARTPRFDSLRRCCPRNARCSISRATSVILNAASWSPLPLATQEAGRAARGPQGPALAARPGISRATPVRARAQRRGAPDQRRSRGRGADLVGRLRRRDGGEDPGRAGGLARAGAAGRPLVAGAGVDGARRRAAASRSRLCRSPATAIGRQALLTAIERAGRGADRGGVDLLGALVRRRARRPRPRRARRCAREARRCLSTPRTAWA